MTTADPPAPDRFPWTALALVALLGLAAGTYPIANTSIGWHVASGRWVLDHGAVPRSDPFTFTAEGRSWVDHEWLFQVLVAAAESLGGPALLVLTRAGFVAAIAALLFVFAWRSGLSPPASLVLATLCLYGARIRFFLRPELATLVLAPLVIWLFLRRGERAAPWRLVAIGLVMAAGANLHGGILVVPPLLAGLLAAELLQWLWSRRGPSPLPSGAAALAVASIAPLLNPYGWRLYAVPLELAHLVGLPHIPNPEWISPLPDDVPPLFIAIAAGLVLLALRERRLTRWALLAMATALALRHVRNVGLFFVLYPMVVAPALATVEPLARLGAAARRPLAGAAAAALAILVVVSMAAEPGRQPGLGYSASYYPWRAWQFVERNGLDVLPAYNDVRFGGWLIGRFYPERRTFIDDRNEIHEPLLEEIHRLLGGSDPAAWQAMLDRYGLELALLRYNEPFTVVGPDGRPAGRRGFSALWFPPERWALVYWDDTAMVLVDRTAVGEPFLAQHEYRHLRPDDTDWLRRRIAEDPAARALAAAELARALAETPDSERALALAEDLLARVP